MRIRKKARDASFQSMWKNAYNQYFRKNPEMLTNSCDIIQHGIMDNYIKKVRNGYEHMFFVVNFRMDIDFLVILNKIEKCMNKKWIKNGKWIWNLEQRGTNHEEMGRGIHFNLYVNLSTYKRPSDCKREVFNTFKNLVGNVMHVVCKFAHDGDNFRNYTIGIKKDAEKNEMIQMDNFWRNEMNLDKWYTNMDLNS